MQDRQAASGDSTLSSVVAAIHATHASFDIWPAAPAQMQEARAFAAALIGDDIVTPETLAWAHERTGASLFLAREDGRLTGVWAALLLTEAGVRACHDDTFNALEPDPDHVAEKTSEPAGVYAWGIAGATKDSSKRMLIAGAAVDYATLSHMPGFTRPTTEAGRRLALERMNFKPVPGSTTGLVWMAPRTARPQAA
jgi:hypothetical protein